MDKELFFIGEPYPFKEGIEIYPPKIRSIITEKNYGYYVQILTCSQEEIEDEFMAEGKDLKQYPTPFEFLLANSYHNKEYEKLAKEAFQFFTKQEVSFLYEAKTIVFGSLEQVLSDLRSLNDLILLTEDEFFDFQNIIRTACGKKKVSPPNPNEHPKVKEMKRKARYRDKVKSKKKNGGISFHAILVSICCMGVGITPLNIGEMSYAAVDDILNKYQDKERYQLDIDTLLAGGDSKKIKPKYWIGNFEE